MEEVYELGLPREYFEELDDLFLPPEPIDYAKHVIQGSQEGYAG